MMTAREITRAIRVLYPRPIRVAVRRAGAPGYFRVRLPSGPAASLKSAWGEGFLTRRLGQPARILFTRDIRRRDCGRDVELILLAGDPARGVRRFRGECQQARNFPLAGLCSLALAGDPAALHRVTVIMAGGPDPGPRITADSSAGPPAGGTEERALWRDSGGE